MEKKQILHITSHLGGGVGRVLLNYFLKTKNSPYFAHKVACLDYANESVFDAAKNGGIKLFEKMSGKKQQLLKMIADADIILIHWWNHPLLYDFLVRTQLPPCRLIMWSHNSGFYPPGVFTDKIIKYPDLFVFTTPISLGTREVKNLSDEQKKATRVIWSTGGVEYASSVKPKKHPGFNVGYIGTVDYAKLHPNFLNICNKIDIPDIKFIVCGGSNEKEIQKEAKQMGISEKFNFTGSVSDIAEYLSIFDIFGYPLAPHHYGTCDQALQESMAAGVVPVVLANPMENYMVKDGITGIVAKNENDYIEAIKKLYYDKKLKNLLSKNTKKYAIENFSSEKMANEWDKIFNEALNFSKTARKWDIKKENIAPKDVFLESLGRYGKDFVSYCNAKNNQEKKGAIEKIKKLAESANWRSKSKGTVHQYSNFFPGDKYLIVWSKLMK